VLEVEVSPIAVDEFPVAVNLLALGMRDNPIHVAVLGADQDRRVRQLTWLFTTLFATMANTPIVARYDGELVGVLGMAAWPACQPSAGQMLRFTPLLVASGPVTASRMVRWLRSWSRHDLAEHHSHLGPVAVHVQLRRQGIGSQMMAAYCSLLDDTGQVGYLETDRPENVAFYQLSGFKTVAVAEVLGVPNWFMRRQPCQS
jgi:ribosomal protein S18 acetylase RimI-like enzyme